MHRTLAAIAVLGCLLVFGWAYRRERSIDRGRSAFVSYGCGSCHNGVGAPNLQNVGKRYDTSALEQFLDNPDAVYSRRGNRPLNEKFGRMPKMKISPEDIPALAAYLRDLSD